MIGEKYGRLTVISFIKKDRNGKKVYLCSCECGNTKNVVAGNMKSDRTRSCGCLQKEKAKEAKTTHSKTQTGAYKSWSAMKRRCANRGSKDSKYYTDKGIKVCDRWLESFENFYKDMGDRPEGMSLDRLDNSKGYSLENCRWATKKEQTLNRGATIMIEIHGVEKCVKDWCKELKLNNNTLRSRVKEGYDIKELFIKRMEELND